MSAKKGIAMNGKNTDTGFKSSAVTILEMLGRKFDEDINEDEENVWQELVTGRIRDLVEKEAKDRAQAVLTLSGLIDQALKSIRSRGEQYYLADLARSLNAENVLMVALHSGNEVNLTYLLQSEGWTYEQLGAVWQLLIKAEWQIVQEIWSHFEGYRDGIRTNEYAIYKREPNWSERHEFEIVDMYGERIKLKGGYFPLVRISMAMMPELNSDLLWQGREDEYRPGFMSELTKPSYIVGGLQRAQEREGADRKGEAGKSHLSLGVDTVLYGAVDIIHGVVWQDYFIDFQVLMSDGQVLDTVKEFYGAQDRHEFENSMALLLHGQKNAVKRVQEMVCATAYQGVNKVGLGYEFLNYIGSKNFYKFDSSNINAKLIGAGAALYLADPLSAWEKVCEYCDAIRRRMYFMRLDMSAISQMWKDRLDSHKKRFFEDSVKVLSEYDALLKQVIFWLGVYDHELALGKQEQVAVSYANRMALRNSNFIDASLIKKHDESESVKAFLKEYLLYFERSKNKDVVREREMYGAGKAAAMSLLKMATPVALSSLLLGRVKQDKRVRDYKDKGNGEIGVYVQEMVSANMAHLSSFAVMQRRFERAGAEVRLSYGVVSDKKEEVTVDDAILQEFIVALAQGLGDVLELPFLPQENKGTVISSMNRVKN